MRGLSVPMTMRSGLMKSSTAAPSFRNSGLETTSNSIFDAARVERLRRLRSRTLSAVPTGTVDLSTTTRYSRHVLADGLAPPQHVRRSAEPSSSGGVPTAMNWNRPWWTPPRRRW